MPPTSPDLRPAARSDFHRARGERSLARRDLPRLLGLHPHPAGEGERSGPGIRDGSRVPSDWTSTAASPRRPLPQAVCEGWPPRVLDYASTSRRLRPPPYLQLLIERESLEDATAGRCSAPWRACRANYDKAEVLRSAAAQGARWTARPKREAFLSACSGISGT